MYLKDRNETKIRSSSVRTLGCLKGLYFDRDSQQANLLLYAESDPALIVPKSFLVVPKAASIRFGSSVTADLVPLNYILADLVPPPKYRFYLNIF